jgi:hypothetical protein
VSPFMQVKMAVLKEKMTRRAENNEVEDSMYK